jgi:pSer/pThr/pTyr-binding forkhead associated (FHA) protein
MPVCQSCGHDNPEGNRFCASCGKPLAGAESAAEVTSTIAIGTPPVETDEAAGAAGVDPAALAALEPGTALLVVARGPNVGSRFLLDASVTTVGRHPDSDIFLDDVTVSRRHAQFRRTDHGFVVADVGSLNGTYVNRGRIDETELHAGDEVQIGKYRMLFHPATRVGAAASEGR